MADAGIPGVSVAWVQNGEVAWTGAFGVRDATTGARVTGATVFEAASLSKPVVAYVALRLAAQGELDLDAPLWDAKGYERLAHDDRARRITARMVLSHTAGLPNWGGTPLELNQDPGSGWNYSGEGFVFLATMLERKTGLSLDELADREVFGPLGMDHSSFVWRSDYDRTAAAPHDLIGRVTEKVRPEAPNAASSLHTTAQDYARFLLTAMNGDGLSEELANEMLAVQAGVEGWGDPETWEHLSWGLGWGLQHGEPAPAIWHWGDNGNFRCFVIAYPSLGEGLVYFSNSNNGLSVAESLVGLVFEELQWSLKYLDYQTWDNPRRAARIGLRRAFVEEPGSGSWELLERTTAELPENVAENETRRLATFLLQEGEVDLGVSVLEWVAERFESAAAHQALGEANTQRGEYVLAESHYVSAVRLDSALAEHIEPRLRWLRDGLEAQEMDYRPGPDELAEYVGSYGPRTIELGDRGLRYSRKESASGRPLVPLAADLFALEGNTTFRIRFERDERGRVVRIAGLYSDGRTDFSERSSD